MNQILWASVECEFVSIGNGLRTTFLVECVEGNIDVVYALAASTSEYPEPRVLEVKWCPLLTIFSSRVFHPKRQ